MEAVKGEFSTQLFCGLLEVSVSGYYRWRRQLRSPRQLHDEMLAE